MSAHEERIRRGLDVHRDCEMDDCQLDSGHFTRADLTLLLADLDAAREREEQWRRDGTLPAADDEESCVTCGCRIVNAHEVEYGTGVFGPDGHGEQRESATVYACVNGHEHDEVGEPRAAFANEEATE